jgi:hypothetical protein
VICKGIALICFALRHVFIVSEFIWPVELPPTNPPDLYVGRKALVSGFGLTGPSKCVDPFNLYSTDKELLLYSQCHVDLIEVTQQYIIRNPALTLF